MNCKPGDLAVVVSSPNDAHTGKICKVQFYFLHDGRAAWAVDPAPEAGCGYFDEWLRPIRDNDGPDESLQWAPVPSRELTLSVKGIP